MEKNKIAFITGITGQDGSYLTEQLLDKGYMVHGLIRRASTFNTKRINHIYGDPHKRKNHLILHYGDLTDGSNLSRLLREIKPDEIYNLAAQSHVRVSFDIPEYTADVVALGALRLLEALRDANLKHTKYYQASSSEMFGNAPAPQSEETPFKPRSPYAVAKCFAYEITKNYRDAYGIFAVNGMLFNHESPRRGETFVTRKITMGIANLIAGNQDKLFLGNLDAKRDWGYAPEYTEAMWMMLQHDKPDDYVVATGETHTVKEFLRETFGHVGLDYKKYVEIDSKYFRPTEVDELCGDISKIKKQLHWKPKTTFRRLCKIMVEADMEDIVGRDWKQAVELFKKK